MMDQPFNKRLAIQCLAALLAFVGMVLLTACAYAAENEPEAPAVEADAEAKQADQQPEPNADAAGDLGDGRLIRVRLPLVGNADSHIKTAIQRAVAQLMKLPRREGRRPVLVLELGPARRNSGFGEGTDFTRAMSLASFLTSPELAPVKTVAYIPQSIKGHGVLVALACEEIVLAPDAELGEAGINEDASRAIEPSIVSAYQQIASKRRPVPEAVALGMLNRRLEVLKVETDQGTKFVTRENLDGLKKNHTIVKEDVLFPAGSPGSFSGREGNQLGIIQRLAADRESLARGLGVFPQAVIEDQSLTGNWRPVMLELRGPITLRKVNQLKTLLATEINQRKVNWIGLTIDSTGGELEDCLRLAELVAGIDGNEVQTVAYVPVDASGGAALVAMACDQLVMQPEAHVGGKGTLEVDRPTLDAATVAIRDSLAQRSEHSWSLLAAMIDPDVELFTYHNTKTGEVRCFSEDEANEHPNADDWQKGQRIKPGGELLRLTSDRAKQLDVATQVVDGFDEFKQLYGFESDPPVAEPNWALELVEALASPALAIFLLVIGFVGIYVELHAPGIGAGAFVSTVAFILFFWSQFLHGTAGWLEVLLFLGGIFFLLLEVMVLPGFGIFGLGGGAMILAALVLASQTFVLPHDESQLVELRHSLTIVAAAGACVVAASLALRRYLPSMPMFRTLLLSPTPENELEDLDYRETLADYTHLIGQQGTAATNLMPSGKADFDGELVDVIAEGLPIDRGQPVVVVKARGSRVLVRVAT
jgi:membrane-bound serine protease (ClpP class)